MSERDDTLKMLENINNKLDAMVEPKPNRGFFGGLRDDRAFPPPRSLEKELADLKERVAYLETNMQLITVRSIH